MDVNVVGDEEVVADLMKIVFQRVIVSEVDQQRQGPHQTADNQTINNNCRTITLLLLAAR